MSTLEFVASQIVIPLLSALFGAGGAFWVANKRR
jgi:hypothetical protein